MRIFLSKLAGLAALCAIVLALTSSGSAGVHNCRDNATCSVTSTCTGDWFTRNGCVIQCYKNVPGETGQIEPSGSANCSPRPGGGTGGGDNAPHAASASADPYIIFRQLASMVARRDAKLAREMEEKWQTTADSAAEDAPLKRMEPEQLANFMLGEASRSLKDEAKARAAFRQSVTTRVLPAHSFFLMGLRKRAPELADNLMKNVDQSKYSLDFFARNPNTSYALPLLAHSISVSRTGEAHLLLNGHGLVKIASNGRVVKQGRFSAGNSLFVKVAEGYASNWLYLLDVRSGIHKMSRI